MSSSCVGFDAVGEDAAVDLRVQRDDAVVEDGRHAGDVVDRR